MGARERRGKRLRGLWCIQQELEERRPLPMQVAPHLQAGTSVGVVHCHVQAHLDLKKGGRKGDT